MHTLALLEKDDVYSSLSIYGRTGDGYQVANYCGRTGSSFYGKTQPTAGLARAEFSEALAVSVDRGWKVVYYGPILVG